MGEWSWFGDPRAGGMMVGVAVTVEVEGVGMFFECE